MLLLVACILANLWTIRRRLITHSWRSFKISQLIQLYDWDTILPCISLDAARHNTSIHTVLSTLNTRAHHRASPLVGGCLTPLLAAKDLRSTLYHRRSTR